MKAPTIMGNNILIQRYGHKAKTHGGQAANTNKESHGGMRQTDRANTNA